MPAPYRTPGVHVEEIRVFPPSVAEVETAVPAFVGYTQKADRRGEDLTGIPTILRSYTQFEEYFGQPEEATIEVDVTMDGEIVQAMEVKPTAPRYILAYCMRLFFDNGGGKCYVVSVGGYGDDDDEPDRDELIGGLERFAAEDEPTLLVVPEAALLDKAPYEAVVEEMLAQCGKLQDRFAILDVKNGEKDITETPADLTAARSAFGENLMYGAAYYPWVVTRVNHWVDPNGQEGKVTVKVGTSADKKLGELRDSKTVIYNAVKAELANHYVTLPPGAALAGVYAATDTKRGVWKSPANVTLANVLEPVVPITNEQQGELNHDAATGKSINVLRAFAGRGTVVWGARTLAGNDNEWRYISVRRFFNMVEESVKKSTAWAVFENNDANTWTKVRGMVEAYLTQKWREGALAGATTRDAFFVRCGLGTTMNSQDILEGRMNVEIGMAVVRPAEFIVLKFTHKLQTS